MILICVPPSVLMKYGYWICGTPEMHYPAKAELIPGKQKAVKVRPVRHFLERIPRSQCRSLELHQLYYWHDPFVHDLARLVISTELKFNNVEVDILNLRDVMAAAMGLSHLYVDIYQIIYDDDITGVPRIDDNPQFRAGLTTLAILTEDEDIPSVSGPDFGETFPTLLNRMRTIQGSPSKSDGYDISDEDIAALLMARTEGWTVVENNPSAQLEQLGLSALSRRYSTLQELVLD
ncbi:hypothetical protein BGZ93_008958 [Podila epicladia]|nr:hypothetical protein BGZ93_008958 [Podila epicladia]